MDPAYEGRAIARAGSGEMVKTHRCRTHGLPEGSVSHAGVPQTCSGWQYHCNRNQGSGERLVCRKLIVHGTPYTGLNFLAICHKPAVPGIETKGSRERFGYAAKLVLGTPKGAQI